MSKSRLDIDGLLNEVRKRFLELLKNEVKAIIIFGSAARPVDFAPSVSNIDVAVFVKKKPPVKVRVAVNWVGDARVNPMFITSQDYRELCSIGHPLAYWIAHDSKVIHDSGLLREMNVEPVVSSYTLEYLFRSALVAMALAAENYIAGRLIEAVNHMYHAVRHAVRWAAGSEWLRLPTSNAEVLDAIGKLHMPSVVRACYLRLIKIRKRGATTSWEARTQINASLRAIAEIFKVEFTDWAITETKLKDLLRKGSLVKLSLKKAEGRLAWSAGVFDLEKMKIVEINL